MRVTGYGLIEMPGHKVLEMGVVRTLTTDGIAERLRKIYTALSDVIEEWKPDALVIEKLYAHYKHPATAILMGHARGVVCLLSGTYKIPLTSIPSTHVKKSVSGYGHAGKEQIQKMVQRVLGLKQMPEPPDVADALAIALTYGVQHK